MIKILPFIVVSYLTKEKMKKVREVAIEIPKTEIRCFFCYCNLKNEVIYNLEDLAYYHYECLLEKFRANEITEFLLTKIDSAPVTVTVPPETKKNY
jgi:hypothetical protein